MRYNILLILVIVLFVLEGQAQELFTLSTDMYQVRVSSGSPLAVVDMNGDLLDDIVHLQEGRRLHVNYQSPSNGGFDRSEVLHTYREAQWSVVVADFDRNGWRDILVGGAYENFFVFFQDDGQFTRDTLDGREIYAQATNAVDIDNDGWTDIFMCNDVGYNVIWWNREGSFERDTTALFKVLEDYEAKGNYGSEWSDVDNDGDLDLYIAKCYGDANSPSDRRRINQLFINEGSGIFTEEAGLRGVASGAQSWTGHFYDADNDGDQDILVSNHDQIAEYFVNDGTGHFEDATMRSRLRIGGPVIQCMALDANGDGWQDVAVGGVPDYLYEYRPSGVYQQRTDELGPYDITSYAIGDLNNDDVPDIYATVGNLLHLPSSIQDRCLFGTTSNEKALAIFLKGSDSNPDGIGARIELFSEGQIQSKVVKAGESYGVQNSFKHIFFTDNLDSVKVTWPNGVEQLALATPSDKLLFWQNHFVYKTSDSDWTSRIDLCAGDSAVLQAPSGFGEVKWSNGVVGESITVKTEGYYQATICDQDDDCLILPGTMVTLDALPEGRVVFVAGEDINCEGDNVVLDLEVENALSWTWEDINEDGPRPISSSGVYRARLSGLCDDVLVSTDWIDMVSPNFDWIEADTIDRSQSEATLRASYMDGHTEWYAEAKGGQSLGRGDEWMLTDVEMDSTLYAQPVYIDSRDTMGWGETSLTGISTSQARHRENASMFFEIEMTSVLVSVDVYALKAGKRRIVLLDRDLEAIDSRDFDLDTGWHQLNLGFDLFPEMGPFRLTTVDAVNSSEFQHRWPAFSTNFQDVKYPYSIDGLGYLKQSLYGYDRYDYFYNWKLVRMDKRCEGERVPLTVVVRTSTDSKSMIKKVPWNVHPNPSDGLFMIEGLSRDQLLPIKVYNAMGVEATRTLSWAGDKLAMRVHNGDRPGLYYLKIAGKVETLVVQP